MHIGWSYLAKKISRMFRFRCFRCGILGAACYIFCCCKGCNGICCLDPPGPYTLVDMAADTNNLMEALGIKAAHVAGASMGGMIAQLLAIKFPARVLSLTSIMSTTGNHHLPGPTSEATAVLLRKRADPTVDMALSIQNSLDAQKVRRIIPRFSFALLYSSIASQQTAC